MNLKTLTLLLWHAGSALEMMSRAGNADSFDGGLPARAAVIRNGAFISLLENGAAFRTSGNNIVLQVGDKEFAMTSVYVKEFIGDEAYTKLMARNGKAGNLLSKDGADKVTEDDFRQVEALYKNGKYADAVTQMEDIYAELVYDGGDEWEEMKAKNQSLLEELDSVKAQMASLASQIKEKDEALTSIKASLEKEQREKAVLAGDYKKASDENEALKKENEEVRGKLRNALDEIEKQMKEAETAKKELEDKAAGLAEELEKEKAASAKLSSELDSLRVSHSLEMEQERQKYTAELDKMRLQMFRKPSRGDRSRGYGKTETAPAEMPVQTVQTVQSVPEGAAGNPKKTETTTKEETPVKAVANVRPENRQEKPSEEKLTNAGNNTTKLTQNADLVQKDTKTEEKGGLTVQGSGSKPACRVENNMKAVQNGQRDKNTTQFDASKVKTPTSRKTDPVKLPVNGFGTFPSRANIESMHKEDFTFAFVVADVVKDDDNVVDQYELIIAPLNTKEELPDIIVWANHDKTTATVASGDRKSVRVGLSNYALIVSGKMTGPDFEVNVTLPKTLRESGHRVEYAFAKVFNGGGGHLQLTDGDKRVHIVPVTFQNNEDGAANFAYAIEDMNTHTYECGDNSEKDIRIAVGRDEKIIRCSWNENVVNAALSYVSSAKGGM